MEFDRIYADIYLDRIEKNMEAMQKNLRPGTQLIGVVKADGYGHGAVAVAKIIDPFVAGYAVATVDEAVQLRNHGIKKGILVLGPAAKSRCREMAELEIRPAVFQFEKAKDFSQAAREAGKTVRIHIAVDTGMSRIGLSPTAESVEEIKKIAALPGIRIEGIFTHFAAADEYDKTGAREQLQKFKEFVSMVKAAGVEIPVCHCSNSAGIVDMPEANFDAVRAGITMYGLYPSREVKKEAVPLRPAMELKSFLTYIKYIEPGTAVSYGGTFVAEKRMRIATVSAGYADGYPRNLSGKGSVLIHGKRAPILGRVCMDQFMVDVTEIPEAKEGELVTLLGQDGGQEISMEELAKLSGGFHYELPCLVGKRVPRRYLYHGKVMGALTCFDGCYQENRED